MDNNTPLIQTDQTLPLPGAQKYIRPQIVGTPRLMLIEITNQLNAAEPGKFYTPTQVIKKLIAERYRDITAEPG